MRSTIQTKFDPKDPFSIPPLARLPEDWAIFLNRWGAKPFVAKQIFKWIQLRGVVDAEKMSDLSLSLRQTLRDDGLNGTLDATQIKHSADGTRKCLVTLDDGLRVETVLMRMKERPELNEIKMKAENSQHFDLDDDLDDDQDDELDEVDGNKAFQVGKKNTRPSFPVAIRVSQCISTQVGCAMGCAFCASGVSGLSRNLHAGEIVAQLFAGRLFLQENEKLRNVVFMGMGEPLHNYANLHRALKLITHPDGIGLSKRKITVSTSGLVPEIERLGQDFQGQIGLAVSLHAADDETRSQLMPINRRYPLAELIRALRNYPLPKRRRITIEYTLIAGRNDTREHALKLAKMLEGLAVKINLIPMNPISASSFMSPNFNKVLGFQQNLVSLGFSCFIRQRKGADVEAACGQLALFGAHKIKSKIKVSRH